MGGWLQGLNARSFMNFPLISVEAFGRHQICDSRNGILILGSVVPCETDADEEFANSYFSPKAHHRLWDSIPRCEVYNISGSGRVFPTGWAMIIPFRCIVIPLTLISGWLILSKPCQEGVGVSVEEIVTVGSQHPCTTLLTSAPASTWHGLGAIIEEGQKIRMNSLPEGITCHYEGDLDDPDFNNVHIEIRWNFR